MNIPYNACCRILAHNDESRTSDSCLMHDYVCIINFCIVIIIIIIIIIIIVIQLCSL